MRQNELEGLVTFVAVAEAGGISSAAAKLGVSPSAVSQAVRQLEQRLGATLFHRTTRSTSLSELGTRYFERVRPALAELLAASAELGEGAVRPSGWLRLNVPRAGYHMVLRPILRRFLEAYPDVSLDVRIDNSLIDIVAAGFDAGIRFGDLVDQDMVTTRVGGALEALVVASPEYLARRGVPRHPRDLADHQCVRYRATTSGALERWSFAQDGEELDLAVTGQLVVSDSEALVQAALDGLGIVYTISGDVQPLLRTGQLVRLLADWSPALPGFTLYYPSRERASPALRAFIELLRSRPEPLGDDDP